MSYFERVWRRSKPVRPGKKWVRPGRWVWWQGTGCSCGANRARVDGVRLDPASGLRLVRLVSGAGRVTIRLEEQIRRGSRAEQLRFRLSEGQRMLESLESLKAPTAAWRRRMRKAIRQAIDKTAPRGNTNPDTFWRQDMGVLEDLAEAERMREALERHVGPVTVVERMGIGFRVTWRGGTVFGPNRKEALRRAMATVIAKLLR